jgi:nucleolar protein 58
MMGIRTNISNCDLSKILPEEVEEQVRQLAEVSMGSEISDEDILNIKELADQIIEIMEYRAQLFDYLKNRMVAIAPNLTALVGELVGARLIAHAGSLMNLAKHPASTVQILGAEKALFRALKTRKDTPKYGLIYHASLVTQSFAKNKGKVSRMLAAKAALATRCDALGDGDVAAIGIDHRAALEIRIKNLEDGGSRRLNMAAKETPKQGKWSNTSEVKTYDSSLDSTLPAPKTSKIEEDVKPDPDAMDTSAGTLLVTEEAMEDTATTPKKVKKAKVKKVKAEDDEEKPVKIMDVTNVQSAAEETPAKVKKAKKEKGEDRR